MTTKDTSGPAFPVPIAGTIDWGLQYSDVGGLTKREWFAGMALASAPQYKMDGQVETIEGMAAYAYQMADAMLKEGGK